MVKQTKRETIPCMAALLGLLALAFLASCGAVEQLSDKHYDISLSRGGNLIEGETFEFFAPTARGGTGEFAPPDPFEIIITNTGDTVLEKVNMVFIGDAVLGEGGVGTPSASDFFLTEMVTDEEGLQSAKSLSYFEDLMPGESRPVLINFPIGDIGGVRYNLTFVAGDASHAARKFYIEYGVFNFSDDANLTVNIDFMQMPVDSKLGIEDDGLDSGRVVTTSLFPGKPWVSSNNNVIAVDGRGSLTAAGPGTAYIGHFDPDTNNFFGRKIQVYAAMRRLDPVYGVKDGTLTTDGKTAKIMQKPNNAVSNLLNMEDIKAVVEVNASADKADPEQIVFQKSSGTVTTIDKDTGTLTFSANEALVGTEERTTVWLELQKTVESAKTGEDVQLVTSRGYQIFYARIGEILAPDFVSAGTYNAADDLFTDSLDLLFDAPIVSRESDVKDGFTVKVGSKSVDIVAGVITGSVKMRLVIDAQIFYGDTITVSYDSGVGCLISGETDLNNTEEDIPVASFTDKPVTNNLVKGEDGPAIQSATLDGGERVTANILTVKYDKEAVWEGSGVPGFAIAGATAGVIDIDSLEADQDDAKTVYFTLKRAPVWAEIQNGLRLTYSIMSGTIKGSKGQPAMAGDVAITLKNFTEADYKPPEVTKAEITGDANGDAQTSIVLTYNKPVSAGSASGFSVTGSLTAMRVTAASVSTTPAVTLTLTLNDYPSATDEGGFKLSYDMALGNVKDEKGNRAPSFTGMVVTFNNVSGANIDTIAPWMVSATIPADSPSIVRVVFSEPVTVDSSLFALKLNRYPYGAISNPADRPAMDVSTMTTENVIDKSVVEGSNDKIWDFTMTTPAAFGDILRITTTAEGGAKDKAATPNTLPKIPEFIVRNEVERVKNAFEYQAGLYYKPSSDGEFSRVNTVEVDANFYTNALNYLNGGYTSGGHSIMGEGSVAILAIGSDLDVGTAPAWATWSYTDSDTTSENPVFGKQNGATVIITTTGGETDRHIYLPSGQRAFSARDSIRFVVEKHIVFTRRSSDPQTVHLAFVAEGGALIINGGEFRDNVVTATGKAGGAITMGGGSKGAYVIMNSGKITGNVNNNGNVNTSGSQNAGYSGAVFIDQFGVFVMHGGEISNNSLITTAVPVTGIAGAIGCQTGTNTSYHGNANFYMTGGEIYGNRVGGKMAEDPAGSGVASAGGVYVNGTFQKVGGTIYGAEADEAYANTTIESGNVWVGAVAVQTQAVVNPTAITDLKTDEALSDKGGIIFRNTTAGSDVTLFIDAHKASNGALATMTIPSWAESFWETSK